MSPTKRSDLATRLHVPQLHAAVGSANGEVTASLLNPRHGRDVVRAVVLQGHELFDISRSGIPQIDGLRESDREDIG